MEIQIDLKCEKAIPLSDDVPQDIVSFMFFLENTESQDYVLINTPNGGFLVSRADIVEMIYAIQNMHYFIEKKD